MLLKHQGQDSLPQGPTAEVWGLKQAPLWFKGLMQTVSVETVLPPRSPNPKQLSKIQVSRRSNPSISRAKMLGSDAHGNRELCLEHFENVLGVARL